MLKSRLIPCLVVRDNLIVQSLQFKNYLPVGRVKITIEFVSRWDVDEIFLVDITATRERRKPNLGLIHQVCERCFVPLTVGGGISEVSDIKNLLNSGADKVSINAAALENPEFITESSRIFGSQCIVVSIDVGINGRSEYEVVTRGREQWTGLHPVEWAKKVERLGAGEIFLNSIDRDGSKIGYDLKLIRMVSDSVNIPVIACGGVGTMEDLSDGIIEGKASAVSAANIFHYTEHSTIVAKAYLKQAGIPIRLNTAAQYADFQFDDFGRILKKDEMDLENIWFEKARSERL